ncbi:MAG: aldo/keto reductase [Gammaproteobacteria bacterium]|nr:aldo/keto reductase [Gammaproteobacteria bacterium]NNC97447.1 aldo/keto reductase [Gammaproteobacteria bacterium]NNM13920.1 aldo/keto reductase [Gammaproteobacteria bacterium]
MQYTKLGSSGLDVSRVCLGTMTWGKQNTQTDADEQLLYALDQGINFIDTAEMYPVMPDAKTQGDTERILGNWLGRHSQQREKLILASKVAGPGLSYLRGGSKVTGKSVTAAIEGSLERLQTDYIDLYQIHWANRTSPHFNRHWLGTVDPGHNSRDEQIADMLDILQAADAAIKAGKIRFLGLSNETPWGLSKYLELSKEHNLPRVVSMQNEFSLLHAKDHPFMLESCIMENIAYLPWSPIAGGALSGKYANGNIPKGSRWSFEQRNGIFRDTELVHKAVAEYSQLARKNNMTPAQLALAWCDQVPGVTSSIIGATTMPQLKEDIAGFANALSAELVNEVLKIFKKYPMPF